MDCPPDLTSSAYPGFAGRNSYKYDPSSKFPEAGFPDLGLPDSRKAALAIGVSAWVDTFSEWQSLQALSPANALTEAAVLVGHQPAAATWSSVVSGSSLDTLGGVAAAKRKA